MFNPHDFESAKEMTVGGCNGLDKDVRWNVETPIFSDLLLNKIKELDAKLICDYGCGNGRLAKYLIENNRQVKIDGIDSSKEMRALATNYVLSDNFKTYEPEYLSQESLKNLDNFKYDLVYAVYCFQHIPLEPLLDAIDNIAKVTNRLLLVNSICRMAAFDNKFNEDGINVLNLVKRCFPNMEYALPFQTIINNYVIRKMFFDGNTLHYAVWCTK